jgi:hypothetical protein
MKAKVKYHKGWVRGWMKPSMNTDREGLIKFLSLMGEVR